MSTTTTTTLTRLAQWALNLDLGEVPDFVIEQAKNQILSMLGAIHSGHTTDLADSIYRAFPSVSTGKSHIIPTGVNTTPSHAAFVMAALSMILDYDDVMLGGHTGHSSVIVPLAYAETLDTCGREILLAQIIANELSARVNMTVAIGSLRGQMATHLHLLGSAAARSKLENLTVEQFSNAVALALSYPAKPLYSAFLGSDAKTLCASLPIRTGLESVDAVLAGMRGHVGILDNPDGFIETFADIPVYDFLQGLGENWHTATNSFKLYPASAYLTGILDVTVSIARKNQIEAHEVERVDVYSSIFTLGMEARSAPYLNGPDSTNSTLTFSTPFTVACAISDHSFGSANFQRDRLKDPSVWDLSRKVHLHHDIDLTIAALTSDIPIGAALKLIRKSDILRFLFGMSGKHFTRQFWRNQPLAMCRLLWTLMKETGNQEKLNFSRMKKQLGAKVQISLVNGNKYEESVEIPRGFSGSGDWKSSRKLMRQKYLDCAGDHIGDSAANNAANFIEHLEKLNSKDVIELINLNCIQRTPTDCTH